MKDLFSGLPLPVGIEGDVPADLPFSGLRAEKCPSGVRWCIHTPARHVFGLGERFDAVDYYGMQCTLSVEEKFTEQGAASYFPVPLFFTELGFGIEVEGSFPLLCDFGESVPGEFSFEILCGGEDPPEIVVHFGSPARIIEGFSRSRGLPALPPEWALGPWISANRWNSRKELMSQIDEMERLGFPATVVVLEAWSDEGGFYAWNDSEDDGEGGYSYPDEGRWPDPEGMIADLGRRGLRLVLWQAPVVKRAEDCPEEARERQRRALKEAEESGYLVMREDGSLYTIPEGRWFAGSPVPDFTSPAACRWWFGKRRYLLDMGVAGFKTDGGEFIHEDDLLFADGSSGREMRSGYAARYLEAFGRFAGPDRVLFSRAGWAGSQRWSLHWAGDQKSEWSELAAQLKAGLSAGLSGIPFWGFDIGGFAGPLPDAELYLRSFELAAFSPLMQWHSEPPYGQFAQLMPAPGGNNDRSPWNIASVTGDERILPICRSLSRLRMALVPYLRQQFRTAADTGLPVMRHLLIDHPDDPEAARIHDQFLLGPDLLVAPVITAGQASRKVYFPRGRWVDVWEGRLFEGGTDAEISAPPGRCALFRRAGRRIPLDLVWIDDTAPPFLAEPAGAE